MTSCEFLKLRHTQLSSDTDKCPGMKKLIHSYGSISWRASEVHSDAIGAIVEAVAEYEGGAS